MAPPCGIPINIWYGNTYVHPRTYTHTTYTHTCTHMEVVVELQYSASTLVVITVYEKCLGTGP